MCAFLLGHNRVKLALTSKGAVAGGFTLIEVLIVVAIIGILAAIAIPQFGSYRTKAYNAAALSDIHMLSSLLESYNLDVGRYPPM